MGVFAVAVTLAAVCQLQPHISVFMGWFLDIVEIIAKSNVQFLHEKLNTETGRQVEWNRSLKCAENYEQFVVAVARWSIRVHNLFPQFYAIAGNAAIGLRLYALCTTVCRVWLHIVCAHCYCNDLFLFLLLSFLFVRFQFMYNFVSAALAMSMAVASVTERYRDSWSARESIGASTIINSNLNH